MEARSMTGAKPTPGPYRINNDFIENVNGDPICDLRYFDMPNNAELFRASWETAAERDRLVEALEILRSMVGAPHGYTTAGVWKAQKFADEILAKVRKSDTEDAGG